jgi:uncharacterized protein YjdB
LKIDLSLLIFLIKDGGDYDLDRQTNGTVWGSMAFVGVPITGITLSLGSMNLSIGSSFDLSVEVGITPPIADNSKVVWHSNNTATATVNSSGIVTGVSTGTAQLQQLIAAESWAHVT